MYKILLTAAFTILLTGCGVLDSITYKIPKQQGNITKAEDVEKLQIGMTKEQVKFVMGTPMSVDSFNTNRWDYIYSYQPGHEDMTINQLTLRFEDNKLMTIDGKALEQKRIESDSKDQSDSEKKS